MQNRAAKSSKYKKISFDEEHNSKWPYGTYHSSKTLIIWRSGSGSNPLLNLINNQPDIDKIYLSEKDPHEAKYRYLISKHENPGLNRFNDFKAFIGCSNDIQDVHKNIKE